MDGWRRRRRERVKERERERERERARESDRCVFFFSCAQKVKFDTPDEPTLHETDRPPPLQRKPVENAPAALARASAGDRYRQERQERRRVRGRGRWEEHLPSALLRRVGGTHPTPDLQQDAPDRPRGEDRRAAHRLHLPRPRFHLLWHLQERQRAHLRARNQAGAEATLSLQEDLCRRDAGAAAHTTRSHLLTCTHPQTSAPRLPLRT